MGGPNWDRAVVKQVGSNAVPQPTASPLVTTQLGDWTGGGYGVGSGTSGEVDVTTLPA